MNPTPTQAPATDALFDKLWEAIGDYSVRCVKFQELAPSLQLVEAVDDIQDALEALATQTTTQQALHNRNAQLYAVYQSIKDAGQEDGVIDSEGNAVAYGVVGAKFQPGTKLYTTQPSGDAGAGAVPKGWQLVPLEFLQGFYALAHNYSMRAIPPDHYRGTEGDAFSNAYRRCGEALGELRDLLAASPLPQVREPQGPCALCHTNETGFVCTRACEEHQVREQAALPDVREALAAFVALKRYNPNKGAHPHFVPKVLTVNVPVELFDKAEAALTQGTSQAAAPLKVEAIPLLGWVSINGQLHEIEGYWSQSEEGVQDHLAKEMIKNVGNGARVEAQKSALQEHADLGQEMGEYGGLSDERIREVILQTVYEGDGTVPYRDQWSKDIGIPFARAILAEAGIKEKP